MEDDGFKVVRNRKGKSRSKKLGYEAPQRVAGSFEDIELALEKASAQMKESGLSSWTIAKLNDILGNRRISRVYLLGNGHFDAPWEPGSHQLVLVKEICDHYNAEMVFQEPCITSDERNWLSKHEKIIIRDAKDTMGVDFTEKKENAVQLVIIIHGLHGLLNDLLRFNWTHYRLQNIVFICNDYRNVELMKGQSEEKSDFDAITMYCKIATFNDFPEYIPHPSFFLNSSIAHLYDDISLPDL